MRDYRTVSAFLWVVKHILTSYVSWVKSFVENLKQFQIYDIDQNIIILNKHSRNPIRTEIWWNDKSDMYSVESYHDMPCHDTITHRLRDTLMMYSIRNVHTRICVCVRYLPEVMRSTKTKQRKKKLFKKSIEMHVTHSLAASRKKNSFFFFDFRTKKVQNAKKKLDKVKQS